MMNEFNQVKPETIEIMSELFEQCEVVGEIPDELAKRVMTLRECSRNDIALDLINFVRDVSRGAEEMSSLVVDHIEVLNARGLFSSETILKAIDDDQSLGDAFKLVAHTMLERQTTRVALLMFIVKRMKQSHDDPA